MLMLEEDFFFPTNGIRLRLRRKKKKKICDLCSVFSAVNSVCWGPYDFGLILACGSSDGAISLLTFTGDQQWDVKKINNAHTVIYGEHICGRDSV